jgi:transcriptional regulator with XRE-family HTH domain
MNIGKRFRELRIKKGFPDVDSFAAHVKMSRSAVSDFENNRSSPTIKTLERFLTFLNCSFAEFFESRIPTHYVDANQRTLHDQLQAILEEGGDSARWVAGAIGLQFDALQKGTAKKRRYPHG